MQQRLAPGPHLRREWRRACPGPGRRRDAGLRGGAGGGHRHVDGGRRGGEHQAVPHVRCPHRKRRWLRADDVQEVQARILLVLPRIPRCKT